MITVCTPTPLANTHLHPPLSQVAALASNAARFPDPFVEGFGWDASGTLVYPGSEPPTGPEAAARLATARSSNGAPPRFLDNEENQYHPLNPYQIRSDLGDVLSR